MAQRCVPAPFLMKTYELVEDESTDDVISWNETGATFVVWKSEEFARNLLPNYFKHNNFSSFIRQLNTYGFRKIVPDRWEFSNEYFKRGGKELLCEIHRRKGVQASTVQIQAGGKSNGCDNTPFPSRSGEELGSTYTSSPDSRNHGSEDTTITQFPDLSDENEKLRKDNQILTIELAQTRKQCEELIKFLSKLVKISPDKINRIMKQARKNSSLDGLKDICEDEFEKKGEEEECLKLFGVWLKGKKRDRDERSFGGPPMKMMNFYSNERCVKSKERLFAI